MQRTGKLNKTMKKLITFLLTIFTLTMFGQYQAVVTIDTINVGRKNYLFAGSHQAAQNAAMLYSFLGSCKINQVEPFAWLKKVLETINETAQSGTESLIQTVRTRLAQHIGAQPQYDDITLLALKVD